VGRVEELHVTHAWELDQLDRVASRVGRPRIPAALVDLDGAARRQILHCASMKGWGLSSAA